MPKSTPSDVNNKLNAEIDVVLADPNTKVRFAEVGGTVIGGTSANFGKLIADETDKRAKVIKFANISRSDRPRHSGCPAMSALCQKQTSIAQLAAVPAALKFRPGTSGEPSIRVVGSKRAIRNDAEANLVYGNGPARR